MGLWSPSLQHSPNLPLLIDDTPHILTQCSLERTSFKTTHTECIYYLKQEMLMRGSQGGVAGWGRPEHWGGCQNQSMCRMKLTFKGLVTQHLKCFLMWIHFDYWIYCLRGVLLLTKLLRVRSNTVLDSLLKAFVPQRSLLVAIRLNLHEFSLIYQTVTCSW